MQMIKIKIMTLAATMTRTTSYLITSRIHIHIHIHPILLPPIPLVRSQHHRRHLAQRRDRSSELRSLERRAKYFVLRVRHACDAGRAYGHSHSVLPVTGRGTPLKALGATLRQKCPKWSFSLCRIASFRQGSAEAKIEPLKALGPTLNQKCPKWSFSLCRMASFRQGSAEAKIKPLKALGPTLRQKCPKWSFSLCRMASFRQGSAEAKIEGSGALQERS